MLLLAMAFPFGAKAATQTGDVNGDGKVSIADVTTLINYLLTHEWPATQVDEYVDLGLGSGTLWATHNLGAINPEDYGDYFAWGETSPKSVYDWSTYRYCNNGNYHQLTKYCNNSYYGYNGFTDNLTILQPGDDAATANYGGRTPTNEEWEELLDNTTSVWGTLNGVNGRLFVGTNGHLLFLPAAGCRWDSNIHGGGYYGYYWSSSLYPGLPFYAWEIGFGSGSQRIDYYDRFRGYAVRAVRQN